MVVLKKLKGSTLMETMVATVLIVVLFMMASIIMNSLMAAQAKAHTVPVKEYMNELGYSYVNGLVELPYSETWKGWEISLTNKSNNNLRLVEIEAKNESTNKIVKSTLPSREP